MKIIIAGNGKIGAAMTKKLSFEGHEVTAIDSNMAVLESTLNQYDVMTVQGNCAAVDVLHDAGVESADLLIAVTGADEINLLCCLAAHRMNPKLHTIARIRNPEYGNQVYAMSDLFALSLVVNPERQAAAEIENLLKYPGFLKRDTFAKGKVVIVELRVDEKSPLVGVALSDMNRVTGSKVLVCAVLRDGKAHIPDGSFVLTAKDRIFVTAPTDTITSMLKNLGIITHKVKKVMVCGGGRISYYLTDQLLKSGMKVTVIEKDPERAGEIARALPGASVILGDAGSQSLLESEGISGFDALVSVTGLDELNLVVSLYGSGCNVPQIITKVGHMENPQILNNLPIGSIIDPKDLCSNIIVRYVRALENQTGAALTIHSIADGHIEAEEFRLDDTARHLGVPLKNLHLRKNALIACITHNNETVIPDGNSVFRKGDTVILVTDARNTITKFNDVFEETVYEL